MAIQIRRGTNTEWESNNSNIVAGEPAIATDAERFFVGTASGDFAEFANLDIIAPAYNTSTSYVVGDIINYHGKLYSCNAPCSGAFNIGYWNETSLTEILKDLENEIDYAQYEIGYADGELITIDNGASEIPVKDLTLDIEAVQDLHGYSHPWAGGAGKNLWHIADTTYTHNGVTFTVSNNIVTVNGTATGGDAYISMSASGTLEANQSYTISGCPSGGTSTTYFLQQNYWGGSQQAGAQDFGNGRTFTPLNNTIYATYIFIKEGTTVNNMVFKPMLEKGSTKSAYEPYANICPINGFDEVVTYVRGKNLWTGESSITVQNASGGFFIGFSTLAGSYKISIPKGTVYFKGHWGGSASAGQETRFYYADGTTVRASLNTLSPNSDFTLSATLEKDAVGMFMYINNGGTLSNIMLTYEENAEYEQYNGQTYTIDLDGTRYGGTLDVTTGVLTLTHAEIDLGTIGWNTTTVGTNIPIFYSDAISDRKSGSGDLVCSNYKTIAGNRGNLANNDFSIVDYNGGNQRVAIRDSNYDNATTTEFNTAMNGVQLVYELDTPQTVQLTPTQVRTLLGTNNLWNQMNSNNELAYRISNALN